MTTNLDWTFHRCRHLAALFASACLLATFGCSNGNSSENLDGSDTDGGGGNNGDGNTTLMADAVFRNGVVYTVNAAQPRATAVAIQNGKIIYVGDDAGAAELTDSATAITDLNGRMLLPGIHDIHMHPLEAGSEIAGTCLLPSDGDPENFIEIFEDCAPNQIGTDWVLGFGHSIYSLFETERLPVEIIDDGIPDEPAAMLEQTSHSVWANSAALNALGIDAGTPDPQGGVIDRDPDSGEATGLLIDNAGNLMLDAALTPNANRPDLAQLTFDGLLNALPQLAENGITSASDARTYWQRGHIEAWKRAEREGLLTARFSLGLWAYPTANDAEQIAALSALYENDPDALLRINQIKFYSDGIIPNGTSALLSPYDESPGFTGPLGLNYFTQTRLQTYIGALETVGFDMNIHAIGDRGVREALNAIAGAATANGPRDRRHRLTHVELIDSADMPRFAQLGVIADAQVAGDFTLPAHFADSRIFIGDRIDRSIPLRDLHEAGARITLSSDWDVSTLNPFVGMQNALTRGDQSLPDLDAVIRAYTIDASYAMRQEDQVGSIEVGKLADLIVIDRNLLEIEVETIRNTKVLLTLLGGETIYRAEGF